MKKNKNNINILPLESNISDLKNNKPFIFSKKINNKSKVIPLKTIPTNLGPTRHYTPAAQEWFNSIYAYDKNYVKSLPVADNKLMSLVKSYFGFYLKNTFKSNGLFINDSTKYRRSSVKKIFVGKGELKHTSSKVIITLYLYNYEKRFLIKKAQEYYKYMDFINKIYYDYLKLLILIQKIRFFSYKYLNKYKLIINEYPLYLPKNMNLSEKKFLSYQRNLTYEEASEKRFFEYLISKILNNKLKNKKLFKNKGDILSAVLSDNLIDNKSNIDLINKVSEFSMKDAEKKRIEKYFYLYSFKLNKLKYSNLLLSKLTRLVSNIYNKEVEFNIVDLKKLHLNSDIYTQAVALKLKNRNNKLYKVLKSSLSKVKIRYANRMKEKYKINIKKQLLINRIRNIKINTLLSNTLNYKDPLNQVLSNILPQAENIKNEKSSFKQSISLEYFILNSLKHSALAGVRLEAKGRLTRRFTAARSIFKLKWKGGLRNVDSSFKGLSTIMLRGHVKSNIQYSKVNSKNRIGTFGIKGWVANK